MACTNPSHNWDNNPISTFEAGKIFDEWLNKSKTAGDNNLLLICGAGICMSGIAPGNPGKELGDAFATYLRENSCDIPIEMNGNIAKIYEYYCYGLDLDDTNPIFDEKKHKEFSDVIGSVSFLNGIPNYSHLTLEKEVRNCSEHSVRIYSVNVDHFFNQTTTSPKLIPSWGNNVINAADLNGKSFGCNEHRNWEILAAHGQISKGFSVWSEMALSSSLCNIPNSYSTERDILSSALACIENGPLFRYIIFAGICAPLSYLMQALSKKLNPDYSWLWINPRDYPQEWLLNFPIFNSSNGKWVDSSFDDVCFNMHLRRYIAWFNACCQFNKFNYDKCIALPTHLRKDLVKGIHRARRLFKVGATVLQDSVKNPEIIEGYHKCYDPYDPPSKKSNGQFNDYSLAETLNGFIERNLRITPDPGDQYPKCSICVNPNTSIQMINIESRTNLEKLIEGIVTIVSECYWETRNDADLLHLVVIDSDTNDDIIAMNKLYIELIEKNTFNPPNVHIIHHSDVANISTDFSEFRRRPFRP